MVLNFILVQPRPQLVIGSIGLMDRRRVFRESARR
jgi:hypothetical protein